MNLIKIYLIVIKTSLSVYLYCYSSWTHLFVCCVCCHAFKSHLLTIFPSSRTSLADTGPAMSQTKVKDAGTAFFKTQQMPAAMADTLLEHLCLLDIDSVPSVTRNTGIVCTIGR